MKLPSIKKIEIEMTYVKKLLVKIQRRKYLLKSNHWHNWVQIKIIRIYIRKPQVKLRVIGDGYGAWAVPDKAFSKEDNVMLVGVGEDVTLDTYFAAQGCRTILCDPTPRAIEYAKAKLSTFLNVEIIEKGIWTHSGRAKFFLPKDPKHVSLSVVNHQHTQEFVELETVTMSDLLNQLGIKNLSILKLDIEGAAYLVLLDIFSKRIYPQIILVDIESAISNIELCKLLIVLRRLGYSLVWSRNRDCLFMKQASVPSN